MRKKHTASGTEFRIVAKLEEIDDNESPKEILAKYQAFETKVTLEIASFKLMLDRRMKADTGSPVGVAEGGDRYRISTAFGQMFLDIKRAGSKNFTDSGFSIKTKKVKNETKKKSKENGVGA